MLNLFNMSGIRVCEGCQEEHDSADMTEYIHGWLCVDCDGMNRVVPIAELAEVFRDWAVERKVTFSTVTLDEFCGADYVKDAGRAG
jgi:hypothetical protein